MSPRSETLSHKPENDNEVETEKKTYLGIDMQKVRESYNTSRNEL